MAPLRFRIPGKVSREESVFGNLGVSVALKIGGRGGTFGFLFGSRRPAALPDALWNCVDGFLFFRDFHFTLHSGAFTRRGDANLKFASAIREICDAPAQILKRTKFVL